MSDHSDRITPWGWVADWVAPVPGSPRARWLAEPGVGRSYALIAALLVAEGLAMLLGGKGRTSGRVYDVINSVSLGQGPQVFAATMLVCGLVMLAFAPRSPAPARTALLIAATGHVLLASGWAVPIWQDPKTGLLGPITFLIIAAWMLSQRATYRPPPKTEPRR